MNSIMLIKAGAKIVYPFETDDCKIRTFSEASSALRDDFRAKRTRQPNKKYRAGIDTADARKFFASLHPASLSINY